MKKWLGILFAMLLLASFANADTLTLVSAPYGVNGPYAFNLNGNTATTTPLICFSEINHVTIGETWTVQAFTINTISSITGAFAGSTFQYNLLGYLADQLFANPGNADLQNAIWAVLGTGGAQNKAYTDAVAWLQLNSWYKTTDLFYIPVTADGKFYASGQGPQPFIAHVVSEPASILLLGAGLLGLAGFRKRKRLS